MSTNNDAFVIAEIQSRIDYWQERADSLLAEAATAQERAENCLAFVASLEILLESVSERAGQATTNAGEPEVTLERRPAGKRERA